MRSQGNMSTFCLRRAGSESGLRTAAASRAGLITQPPGERWRRHHLVLSVVLSVAMALLAGTGTLCADPPGPAVIRTTPALAEPIVSAGIQLTLIAQGHGGTGPFTYTWQLNGQDIAGGQVANQLRLSSVKLADAGEYTVRVQTADGESVSAPYTLEVDPRFRKVALPELGDAMTAAWGDLDGDGWLDVVTAHAGHIRVHINARDGTLPLRQDLTISNQEFLKLVTLADFDNDGLPDLVMSENWEDRVRIFRNAGTGTLVSKATLTVPYTCCPSWVDLDADGYLDLFVVGGGKRPDGNAGHVYLNQAGARFRSWRTGDPGQALVEAGYGIWVAWGDYDADGRLDAAGSGALGSWWVLHGGPAGSYDPVPGMIDLTDRYPDGRGDVAWADYDNDGDLDLLIGGFAEGLAWFFRNDGGVFTKMTSDEVGSVVTDPPSAVGLAWGDYDNDGDLDLYVARWIEGSSTEFNYLYENQGDGMLQRVRIGSPTTSINSNFAAYWVDYDRDGFLDLHVPALANPPTHLFHNELGQLGNRNGWLEVRCEGRVTNRDGIGATVRLKARIGAAERWQMRQIASSCTGQPLVAHFGLGDATQVAVLRVEWPSGAVQEYKDVDINQSLVIKEPTRLVLTGPCAFRVKSWPGMQFAVQASLDLETWSRVGSVTNINGTAAFTDAAGAQGTCRFYRVVED